jgi:hypothetical protein
MRPSRSDLPAALGEQGTQRPEHCINAMRNVAVRAFQRLAPRGGAVEIAREPCAIGSKRMQLGRKVCGFLVRLASAFNRSRKRIKRKREPFIGSINCG